KPLREADRSDGFAFAAGGWGGGRDKDELAAPRERGVVKEIEAHFSAVGADLFEIFLGEFQFSYDFLNRTQGFGHVFASGPVAAARSSANLSFGYAESREGVSLQTRRLALFFPLIRIPPACG